MYKIYKIVDNTNDNVYIGITTQTLKKRLKHHRCNNNCCKSRDIIKNGDYRIELIEETDDKSRERHWILNTECINKIIPGRTKKEYYEENKDKILEKHKEWREENKDKIVEKQKEWRENNKDKIADKKKEYCEKNKEKIVEYKKEYREKNKEKIAKKEKEYREKNKEKRKARRDRFYEWYSSMGGRPDRNNISLLKIDVNLFS